MSSETLIQAVSRLEKVASRLESLAHAQSSKGGSVSGREPEAVAPFVTTYDEILKGKFAAYLSLSAEIGGDVKAQSDLVSSAFSAQREFLVVASKSAKPAQSVFMDLLKPTSESLQAVQDFREKNRTSNFFNHLSAISESIAALGWVTVSPAPGPYVKENADAGTFYTNRVLKDYKEKDQKHVDWTKAWNGTLTELQAYIKQYHTTEISWNPQGGNASAAVSAPKGGAPPPPPPPGPPPPPPPPSQASDVSSSSEGDRNALFKQLNQGQDITKGLKKVTDDMKTHKNPALRQGPAPYKAPGGGAPKTAPKPVSKPVAAVTHTPLTELQDKKWIVEYHNNHNVEISDTQLKQTVYIFKCTESVVQVKGKVNSIILDNCKKTSVVLDDLLSSLEFINCQSVKGQIQGKVPTVGIDKTDGCMIYLSKDSLDTHIVTAKSSEMNVLVPDDDGDYKEFPIPEQFKTVWDGKKFVTTPSDTV